MAAKIIGLVIGILVLAAGVYYLGKEKNDPESRKIYGVISAVGGVVAVGPFLRPYRSFRSQPCSDDGSRSHACRRRKRKPELDSSSSGKPFCMWYGGPDRRYPGASSGIL